MTVRLRPFGPGLGVEIPEAPQTAPLQRFELTHELSTTTVRPSSTDPSSTRGVELATGPDMACIAGLLSTPRETGRRLFDALFRGAAREALAASRSAVVGAGDRGLRLRIIVDADNPRLRSLLPLPWELLYQSDTRNYLALDGLTPVVRSLALPTALRPRPLDGPLQVAVAVAAPTDRPELEADAEVQALRDLQADRETSIEFTFLELASLEALRQLLHERSIDIVHFIGHGHFDPATGRTDLAFVGADHRTDRVPAGLLGQHLRGPGRPRLVVLNACHGARFSNARGSDPFNSAAAAIALGQVPAVLAMQWDIGNTAAIALSRTLYRSLASGDCLEAAVTEARLAISRLGGLDASAHDWAAPALYLHAADGALFERAGAGTEANASTGPERLPGESSIGDFRVGDVRGVVVGHESHVDGNFNFGGGDS